MERLKKSLFPLAVFAAALTAFTACSPKLAALRETAKLVHDGAPALFEEPDPQLARESFGANLKLLEMLLRDDPRNRNLLELAAEGFGGYAFLFLEDSQPDRAKGFYLRGRDYGLRLAARNKDLARLGEQTLDEARAALAKARPEDVPGLFWAAFGWAGYINLSKDSPAALADLPKVTAVMDRVQQLDPDYHFAGADLYYGIYYGSRPAILGGDLKKAAAAFQDARRRTGGKYLMTYVLEAKYLAVGSQDQELFKSLLGKVREEPAGQLPEAMLTDQVAKDKAEKLMEKMNDLF